MLLSSLLAERVSLSEKILQEGAIHAGNPIVAVCIGLGLLSLVGSLMCSILLEEAKITSRLGLLLRWLWLRLHLWLLLGLLIS